MPTSATVRLSRAIALPLACTARRSLVSEPGRGLALRHVFPPKSSWKVILMRNSSFGRSDSGGWGTRIAIGIGVLILLGLTGLVFYGSSLRAPPHRTYE